VAALSLAACAADQAVAPGAPERLDALPRTLTAAEQDVLTGSNGFAFALLREVGRQDAGENVFVSPLSASMALGMTMNGANGPTLDEIQSALGLESLTLADANASYRSLISLLRSLDPSTDFRIANSIWYREGYPFEQSFFTTTHDYFDAEVGGLDFADPGAVATINAWVDEATGRKIPTIIDEIADDQVMFLINAIYFDGRWRSRFEPAETRQAPFTLEDGTQAPVDLMHQRGTLTLARGAGYTALDLPYGNAAFSMTVLLPDPGVTVDDVASALTPESWAATLAALDTVDVDLHLPKLKLSYEKALIPTLQALGIHAAFVPGGADFTRMSPAGHDLFVSMVLQKTFLEVDEAGTRAAAATVVGIGETSAGPEPTPFRVDRPFLVAIRERLSGTILFLGRIVTPPEG
jgi:serpin B